MAASPNLYFLDLVKSGRMLIDRGIVLPDGEVDNIYLPVDTFKLLRIDDSVVYKKMADIKVVDRSHLYPGQVVGSARDMGGQIGVVTGVNTVLSLVKLDNDGLPTKVIRGVSPSSLRRIRSLNLGDFVVSGPWLGRIVEVSIDVDVLFDDGAVCRVTNAESTNLARVRESGNMDTGMHRHEMNSQFHQGQQVSLPGNGPLFKDARWLSGYWHPYRQVGTIMKVETSAVLVYWVASMHCGTDKGLVQASAPPAYQNPDHLTFFCASYNCCWGLADRCLFRETSSTQGDVAPDQSGDPDADADAADDDEEEEEEEEYNACSQDNQDVCESSTSPELLPTKQNDARFYRKQLRKVVFEGHRRGRRLQVMRHAEVEFPMVVADTCTTVDVLWQDGTRQHGRRSATIAPFGILNEQEFLPGQHVVANVFPTNDAVDDHDDMTTTSVHNDNVASGIVPTERVGIVKSVQYGDQTVTVSWFKTLGHLHEPREVDCEETVSAYDLKLDSNHSAYYGDIVIRLLPSGSTDDGESAPLLKGNKKKYDLSWVGRVVEVPNGQVQVKWGDGSMSTVSAHDVAVVNDEHYMELWLEMGDWVEDNGIDDPPEEQVAANTEIDLQNLDNDVEGVNLAMSRTSLLGFSFRSLLQLTSHMVARGKGYLSWFGRGGQGCICYLCLR
uniref:Uncharacterized protein n=1 Tax=Hordeum vulgare subsp. vulgare TaxID=112509 RepID=A0A8I6WMW3_HORVV